MSGSYDRYLGMDRPITRRDFMNGAVMVIGAALLPRGTPSAQPIQRSRRTRRDTIRR